MKQQRSVSRQALQHSRALEYFTEKELTLQTGHAPDRWADVIVKELVDNALDACEEAGVPPDIGVVLNNDGIIVSDNGPGIPPDVLTAVLDFSVRVSSKDGYVSPSRGSQGNALKTVIAVPYVLSEQQQAEIHVRTRGRANQIRISVDRIAQEPRITRNILVDRSAKRGTSIEVRLPESARLHEPLVASRLLQLIDAYAIFNPHAAFTGSINGSVTRFPRAVTNCSKWVMSAPTSPEWYTAAQLRHLMAAHIAGEARGQRPITVREFIAGFRGLSSTAKQKAILSALPIKGLYLRDFLRAGDLDAATVETLLQMMRAASAPMKPQALGCLGDTHLRSVLKARGCHEATSRYRRVAAVDDATNRPFVLEVAFAVHEAERPRCLLTGLNWAPTLVDPFRELATYGVGLDALLHDLRAGVREPVTIVIHLACPHLSYTDRGKSGLEAL